ncbi:MAG: heme ABC transporter ATP-binding protein [bacterium]
MYRISQLSVRFGTHVLLHSLSAELQGGQLCMVVGPNGAGKTTLLKCLDGEIQPTKGVIEFNDQPLDQWPTKELAKARAVLSQSSSLEFPFTVQDVVLMGRLPHDTSSECDLEIVIEVLDLCDCSHLAQRAFPTLSGGEQQRVQTARVLAQVWREHFAQDRFLLLDEPISALDLSHQHSLLRLLKHLTRSQGVGVLCTLHNLNLAAQYADRCLILDQGRLVADGAASEVFTEETISNVFDLDIWLNHHPQDPSIPLIVPRIT